MRVSVGPTVSYASPKISAPPPSRLAKTSVKAPFHLVRYASISLRRAATHIVCILRPQTQITEPGPATHGWDSRTSRDPQNLRDGTKSTAILGGANRRISLHIPKSDAVGPFRVLDPTANSRTDEGAYLRLPSTFRRMRNRVRRHSSYGLRACWRHGSDPWSK